MDKLNKLKKPLSLPIMFGQIVEKISLNQISVLNHKFTVTKFFYHFNLAKHYMAKFELWRETSIRQNEWQFHCKIYLGMQIFAYNLAGKIFLFKVVKMDLSVSQQKKLPQLLDLSKCKYISIFALWQHSSNSNIKIVHNSTEHFLWNLSDLFFDDVLYCLWIVFTKSVFEVPPQKIVRWVEILGKGWPGVISLTWNESVPWEVMPEVFKCSVREIRWRLNF